MGYLDNVTQDDIAGFKALEPGLYAVELSDLAVLRNEERNTESVEARFTVLARLDEDEWKPLNTQPTVSNYFTFVKRDGSPNEVASRIYATMISALTLERDVAKIKNEYDADSLDELVDKASILITLRCRAWIGTRKIVTQSGTAMEVNTISNFRPLTEADDAQLKACLGEADGKIPF